MYWRQDPHTKWVAVYRIVLVLLMMATAWLGLDNKNQNDVQLKVLATVAPLVPTPTP